MDNFDNPIDDLLSEGDSFFEDPKLLAKKSTPKKTIKTAANLFGFDTDNKPVVKEQTNKNEDWLGITSNVEEKSQPKDTTSDLKTKKPVSFEKDDINNLLELSTSTTQPKSATTKKSSSLLSDILGETKQEEKKISFDDILQSSNIRKKENPIVSEPKPAQSLTQNTTEYIPAVTNREPRRGRRNSPSLIDPLGIFESQKTENVEIKQIHEPKKSLIAENVSNSSQIQELPVKISNTKTSELPNWLSDSDVKSEKPQKESTSIAEVTKPVANITVLQTNRGMVPEISETIKQSEIPDHMFESLLTQQKIASSHVELQNASLALQQQESQLMIAVQLKKYEESLTDMQRKQQEMLLKQDMQFNSLLERQFSKQQAMETNMRLQQERINNHIQVLLSHPSGSVNMPEQQQQKNEYIKQTFEENRKFYDDIVNSLKQKHHEEIFLLEESYKKQLTFLENSLESTEKRLKTEIENINKHYIEKIQELSAENETIIAKYEAKLKQLYDENLTEIETIKENCKITVSDVRNEYRSMMDDLTKTKSRENETIIEAEMISKKIEESVLHLQGSSQAIFKLHDKFNDERQIFVDVKEETLNAKESEIKMMQVALEIQRQASDGERGQLLALVRTLETRVAEQTQAAREERWTLQQASATLAARGAALDREAEFVKRNLERERDQIKTLRETLLAEHESTILKLTEEKLAINAEKSRLETSAKLAQNFDTSKARTEIAAAIQVAKEATELTDRERENLCRQQCELEILKRSLHDREAKLTGKERELEKFYKKVDQKYMDGERTLTEAKMIEQKYTERLQEIQKQMVSLATREKKLTDEKIALSKDRLTLHAQINDNKKCGLCEADNFPKTASDYTIHESRQHAKFAEREVHWGTDAEIMRLKFDLENDNIVSKEQSVISENSSEK